MKVLLLGGAGHVGTFIIPYLRQRHHLRVLDLHPPRHDVEYVEGSVTDPDALQRALTGMDAFIWVVMRKPQGGAVRDQDVSTIVENYEVNAKALHLTLFIAQQLGVMRGIYTSSMSVHYRMRERFEQEELVPLDTPTVYGLSKGFGELICQYFARWWDMNLIALRITGPRTREQYLDERISPRVPETGKPIFVTDEEDLANAYLASLEAVQVGHGRFDAFFIAGDEHEKEHNLSKAQRVLGWTPRSHRLLE
ncbi:MAG: NAD(P)-dependent oxidoreductase [Chloroflexi bacterium]|nr:NAD(P)-dependent oxidoreductase [Chloroflexota bacterium]